jgi:hypothetical protein
LVDQESDAANVALHHGICPLPQFPTARTIAVNLIFMRVLVNWNKTFLGRPWINLM